MSIHIEPIRVHADPDLIGRALRNLSDNATRRAASTVSLTMNTVDDWAVIAISDDGPGVPEDQRDRIFDRFARLDPDRRRADGAGLGLAIVRQITDHPRRADPGGRRPSWRRRVRATAADRYQHVTPTRPSGLRVHEAISRAADRLDRGHPEQDIDPFAEIPDIHLDAIFSLPS